MFALTVFTGCGSDQPNSSIVRSGAVLAPPVSVALTASQDTTLRVLLPNQNFGDDTNLDINRALVQFDSAALKAAVGPQDLVVSAKLELALTNNRLRTYSRQVGAFRLTAGWTELGATWNCPTDSNLNNYRPDCAPAWSMGLLNPPNPWVNPATSVITVPAAQTGSVAFDVTADVLAFVKGTAVNSGWMLRGSTPGEFAEFASRESGTPPRLVLTIQRCSASLCDDGNACTVDSCDATAHCAYTAASDGTTCSDGNACTQTDSCQDGVCAGESPVICVAADQCHQAGTCDQQTGACDSPPLPTGSSCGAGNVCDEGGACVQCLAASSCPGADSVCGARTCTAGACGVAFAPAGTSCGTGLACDGAGACAATFRVVVNEVESNGGTPGDWVELYNAGGAAADLSSWIFRDSDDTHAYLLPAGTTLAPGAYLLLEEAQFGFGLGAGDSARLFDSTGAPVDSYAWTAHAANSYGRCPNGSGAFRNTFRVTKGAANDCTVPMASIKLNEVESNGGTPGDWVELYNAGSAAADLSSWIFRDSDDTHAYLLPGGTTLAPGAYLVLEEAQFGFGLGAGDSARIFDAQEGLIDSHVWTAHAAVTYGRCPNGAGALGPTTISTKGAANDCTVPMASIKINEVESNGGTPGDWVELYNAGSAAADLSSWIFRDSDDTHAYLLPAGTTLAPGAYLVLEEAQFGFGLGAGDSARIFDAQGGLIDSHVWTAHAAVTYARCPNGTGALGPTMTATKGGANDCGATMPPVAQSWPGANKVATVDGADVFGGNLSDLFYEPGTAQTLPTLWAVRNGPALLHRLLWNGAIWAPDTSDGWNSGKTLLYPNGGGTPDAEGVTRAELSSPAIYVATERDNDVGGVSRLSILRYDVSQPGTELTATHEWNLNGDLPVSGSNLGLEALTWVPDSHLLASGFIDEAAGRAYDPARYPEHGTGLFFVGLESNGVIYAYALNHATGAFSRVATIASGNPGVMSVSFDRDTGYLWAHCDDTCGNVVGVLSIDTAGAAATKGKFKLLRQLARPSSMANLNNEGIALASEAECVAGFKGYYWADDGATSGHALRFDSVPCGRFLP